MYYTRSPPTQSDLYSLDFLSGNSPPMFATWILSTTLPSPLLFKLILYLHLTLNIYTSSDPFSSLFHFTPICFLVDFVKAGYNAISSSTMHKV